MTRILGWSVSAKTGVAQTEAVASVAETATDRRMNIFTSVDVEDDIGGGNIEGSIRHSD
ncbi:hypothetical protein [Ruegeria sp. Alg231-54]|uniref:hypothetical protein n=1 Tax=Ruegeria sp. Alg231-54 TaxID=1922221 RepID=UPI001F4793F5|nr:hypothetical protein [Ruegeria sp. Alg231-54]